MPDDRIVRVARDEQDADFRVQFNHFLGDGPPAPGITTSVISRCMGPGQFPVGVRNLIAHLGYHLGELGRILASLREDITAKRLPPAGLASWLADVRQFEDEFGDVEVKWKETVVRVVTDPIELRDVELGPFAIDFHWDRLGSAKGVHCFDFIALEPNPAARRDEVVHPHVQGHDLCAGDAVVPLQRALEQGRFPEAFLILRSVLTTYN